MHILHYSLGLPPYRSGGLTKYSVDLMLSQIEEGHCVTLLYPGSYCVKSTIARNNEYKGIQVFELKRPTPVPLLDGVKEPAKLIPETSENIKYSIRLLIDNVKPDAIHIHTLMGLPNYLLEYAKELGIKIYYTTHDYYGICLRVNLIDSQGLLCEGPTPLKCAKCNKNGSSVLQMNLRNLRCLHRFKSVFRKVIPIHNNQIIESPNFPIEEHRAHTLEYELLMENYKRAFSLIDLFLYNSSVSQEIYKHFLPKHAGIIRTISHRGIKYNEENTANKSSIVQLLYIGTHTPYKGLPGLIHALDQIYAEGIRNFHLEIWGTEVTFEKQYTTTKGFFSSDAEYKQVFSGKDLLICPSTWNETFGFVVLEALSHQVPALVSSTVGAKDIINTIDSDFVFEGKVELKEKLIHIFLEKDKLTTFRYKLQESLIKGFEMSKHTEEVLKIYSNML